MDIQKRLLTIKETANYLGISPRTIYNQIGWKAKKKFVIRPVRVGRIIRFDKNELDNFIETKGMNDG